jgi:hypothetical protein
MIELKHMEKLLRQQGDSFISHRERCIHPEKHLLLLTLAPNQSKVVRLKAKKLLLKINQGGQASN